MPSRAASAAEQPSNDRPRKVISPTRWMDPEISGRYGTGVYVRCGPEGVARSTRQSVR